RFRIDEQHRADGAVAVVRMDDIRPDDDTRRHAPVAACALDADVALDRHDDLDGVMVVGRNDPFTATKRDEAAIPEIPVRRPGPPARCGHPVSRRFPTSPRPRGKKTPPRGVWGRRGAGEGRRLHGRTHPREVSLNKRNRHRRSQEDETDSGRTVRKRGKEPLPIDYSFSTAAGFTPAARRAGNHVATSATVVSSSATPPTTTGPVGLPP